MKLVLLDLHFVKGRDKQDVNRTTIIDQDPLDIEIGDNGKHNQSIVMGEMMVSQMLISEGDGRTHLGCG